MWEDTILNQLLPSFYENHLASKIQIDSFNHMIHFKLSKIFEEEVINIKIDKNTIFRVSFDNCFVEKPFYVDENRNINYFTPMEARIKDLNYSGSVLCDVHTCHIIMSGEKERIENYKLYRKKLMLKIPICVGSDKCNLFPLTKTEKIKKGECSVDVGGYYIVKGKERILVSQERINNNEIYIFKNNKSSCKFDLISEVRSLSEETRHSVLLQVKLLNRKLFISIPYLQNDVEFAYVLRAYGVNHEEIELLIKNLFQRDTDRRNNNKILLNLFLDMKKIKSREAAIKYLSEKSVPIVMKENKIKFIEQILDDEILPSLGILSTIEQKIIFLLTMVEKMMLVMEGKRSYDDRDHLSNKRVEAGGCLIGDLIKTLFKRFCRLMMNHLDKKCGDVNLIFNKLKNVGQGLGLAMATGNWGVPKSNYIRCGVSQIISRLTYGSYLSHLRRLLVPLGKEGKNTRVRQIHTSTIGFIDPHETPEGQQSGIVKNINQFIKITQQSNVTFLREIIEGISIVSHDFKSLFQTTKELKPTMIFLNGGCIAFCFDSVQVLSILRDKKKKKIFSSEVSISFRPIDQEIHIYADVGRLQRPLFQRGNMPTIEELQTKSLLTLEEEQKIIYMDSYELEEVSIAMTKQEFDASDCYDFLEIHPSFINGFSVSLIPYPSHTQSPRVTYSAAQMKQAIGLPFTNLTCRCDTSTFILSYPEFPIIQSHHAEYNHGKSLPMGSNCIVAIFNYTGFNQEDSIIVNRAAIQRGLLRCFSFRTLIVEEKKKSTLSSESIQYVSETYQNKAFNYNKLNKKTGIVKVGAVIGIGDVIVSKLLRVVSKTNDNIIKDNSVICKFGEEGIVDQVFSSTNSDGYKIVKIKVRVEKIPELGDKLASRAAQKGTISILLNEEDMPFSEETGIVPDIIINTLCIPSRMTISQLLESFLSKKSLEHDKKFHCTAFSESSTDIISKVQNEDSNYHIPSWEDYGNEYLVNGCTGERTKMKIFVGPTYYLRLKHLVSNKIHARNHGNKQGLTRQPLEGRSRDGGLRFGEMERDALLSYGLSRFIRERLFKTSDYYSIKVCSYCGATPHNANKSCNICGKNEFVCLPIPFACKLLFQQLGALGIRIDIFPKTLLNQVS